MKQKLVRDKRGISPVITTVILVAVGIAIAVAVALWMSGLVGLFTRFEQLEIKSRYVDAYTNGSFQIHVIFSNTGTTDTSVDNVLVNGKPYGEWGCSLNYELSIPAPIGTENHLIVTIPSGASSGAAELKSGVTVTITLHSTGGKEYLTSVALP